MDDDGNKMWSSPVGCLQSQQSQQFAQLLFANTLEVAFPTLSLSLYTISYTRVCAGTHTYQIIMALTLTHLACMYNLLHDYCLQRVVFEVPTVYQVGLGQLLLGSVISTHAEQPLLLLVPASPDTAIVIEFALRGHD